MKDSLWILPEWINTLLKVILVIVFPSLLSIGIRGVTPEITFGCFLYLPTGGAPVSPGLGSWMVAGLILLPGALFTHRMQSRPLRKPIWRMALGCLFSILLMWPFLTVLFPPVWLQPSNLVLPMLSRMQVLSVAFLILYPILQREVRIITVPEHIKETNPLEIEEMQISGLQRNKLLATVLWVAILFCPLFGTLSVLYTTVENVWVFEGLFFEYYILKYPATYVMPTWQLAAGAQMFPGFLLMLGFSSIRLLFLRYLFMFLKAGVTRTRFLAVAVLGETVPYVVASMPQMLSASVETSGLVYPFPVFILIGFVCFRLFDLQREQDAASIELAHLDDGQDTPEEITVPMLYVLKSKMKNVVKRLTKSSAS